LACNTTLFLFCTPLNTERTATAQEGLHVSAAMARSFLLRLRSLGTPLTATPETVSDSDQKTAPKVEIHSTPATTSWDSPASIPSELKRVEKTHQYDPNLKKEKIDELHAAIHSQDPEVVLRAQVDFTENSPYEEVRAAVRTTDGGEPANTLRAWILGMLFVTAASGLNMFLSMRSPAINFPSVIVLL
jgi:hypothetical protein